MKIACLVVGKTTERYLIEAVAEYGKRIGRYVPFEFIVVPELKNARNRTQAEQRELEAERILALRQPGDRTVLLDERGREFTSAEFAAYIEHKSHTVPKRLLFVIGGPYGFSDRVYEAADERISLSKMTFSHQMIRLLFTEQLYRAFTILNNEPYHHP